MIKTTLTTAKAALLVANRNGFTRGLPALEAINNALGTYEYIYSEAVGNGEFTVARLPSGLILFIFLDKHNSYNVFEEMEEFIKYNDGDLDVERVCFDNVYFEEGDEGYQEGVDALDRYLSSRVEEQS